MSAETLQLPSAGEVRYYRLGGIALETEGFELIHQRLEALGYRVPAGIRQVVSETRDIDAEPPATEIAVIEGLERKAVDIIEALGATAHEIPLEEKSSLRDILHRKIPDQPPQISEMPKLAA